MRSRLPAPLAALLAAVAVIGLVWAFVVPPFQAPDENSHFGYAQFLAERFELPGDANRPIFSREQLLAHDRSNSDQTAAVLATKPEWSRKAYRRWQAAERKLSDSARGDGGGPNPASTNPPLYYLYEAPAYLVASGGDIFDRLYVMRVWSVVLLLVTTLGAWLLAGELFGRVRPLQLTAATVAGLQPMVTFISASVSPDGMLFALWGLAFWLGVRILKRGLRIPDTVALFAVVGLAIVTKATGYALLPAALLVLAVGVARLQGVQRRTALAIGAIGLVGLVIPVGAWLATARALDRSSVNEVSAAPGRELPRITSFNPRELGSYLWQFYLPKLPFQKPFGGMQNPAAWNVWLKGGWGSFGWLEVKFPSIVYAVLAIITMLVLAGAAVAVVRVLPDIDWAIAAFIAMAVLALLAGLHWTEFRTLVGGSGPFNQGRYLLPLISLMGAATAAAVTVVPTRQRGTAIGLLVGGIFVLQLMSLAVVAGRFYA